MNNAVSVEALDRRARELGYEVIGEDLVGFPFNMGGGPWVRVLKDGKPCFKFSWRAEEVDTWLKFREREARPERLAA